MTKQNRLKVLEGIFDKYLNINDGKCYVCGEMTNSMAGNPSMWGHCFPHVDGQTKHRHYHMKCLYPILRAKPEITAERIEEVIINWRDLETHLGNSYNLALKSCTVRLAQAILKEINQPQT